PPRAGQPLMRGEKLHVPHGWGRLGLSRRSAETDWREGEQEEGRLTEPSHTIEGSGRWGPYRQASPHRPKWDGLAIRPTGTAPALGLRAGGVVLPMASQAETTRETKNVIRILASRSVPARRNASPQIPASRGTAKNPPPKPGAAGGPRRADRR